MTALDAEQPQRCGGVQRVGSVTEAGSWGSHGGILCHDSLHDLRQIIVEPCLFDGRADTYCSLTSDSDFAYLCRKLRERGAMVCIVGEEKTPDALRNASDQFFAYQPSESEAVKKQTQASAKKRPKSVTAAVSLLAADSSEGWVGLGALGQYMKRSDPGFSPKKYGHSGLLEMVQTYPDLAIRSDGGGHWVQPKAKGS
jgi:hypothetical protein